MKFPAKLWHLYNPSDLNGKCTEHRTQRKVLYTLPPALQNLWLFHPEVNCTIQSTTQLTNAMVQDRTRSPVTTMIQNTADEIAYVQSNRPNCDFKNLIVQFQHAQGRNAHSCARLRVCWQNYRQRIVDRPCFQQLSDVMPLYAPRSLQIFNHAIDSCPQNLGP